MATMSDNFIPELWSDEVLNNYKKGIFDAMLPKRSKGAQLLRDAALGHPEYPKHITATEVTIRYQYAKDAAKALVQQVDNDMLDALKYSIANVRIVSS